MVLTNRQNQMFRISLFFPGVVYLLTVPLLWLFTVTVARETTFCIKELMHAVKERRQGNVVYRIHTCTLGGLRILYRECNRMMTQLQHIRRDHADLSKRKRHMKIKSLEAPFNPHFVFNILETLRNEMHLAAQRSLRTHRDLRSPASCTTASITTALKCRSRLISPTRKLPVKPADALRIDAALQNAVVLKFCCNHSSKTASCTNAGFDSAAGTAGLLNAICRTDNDPVVIQQSLHRHTRTSTMPIATRAAYGPLWRPNRKHARERHCHDTVLAVAKGRRKWTKLCLLKMKNASSRDCTS